MNCFFYRCFISHKNYMTILAICFLSAINVSQSLLWGTGGDACNEFSCNLRNDPTCTIRTSYIKPLEQIQFQIILAQPTRQNIWYALGFNSERTPRMIGTNVVMIKFGSKLDIYLGYLKYYNEPLRLSSNYLFEVNAQQSNGKIVISFSRNVTIRDTSVGSILNLYECNYLVVGSGSINSDESIRIHQNKPVFSRECYRLTNLNTKCEQATTTTTTTMSSTTTELFSSSIITSKETDSTQISTEQETTSIKTEQFFTSTQEVKEESTLFTSTLSLTSSFNDNFLSFNVKLKLDQTFREEYRNRSSPEFIILHQDLSNYVRKSLEDNGLNGLQYILINQVNPGSILVSFDLIYKQLNNENVDEETLLKALTSRNNLGDNLNVVYSNTQVSKINDNNINNTNQPTFETNIPETTTTSSTTKETTSSQLFDTFQSTVNNSDILTTQSESQSTSKDIESTISTFPQELTSSANLFTNQTDILSTTQLESESTTIIQSQSTSPSLMEDSTQNKLETSYFSTQYTENISLLSTSQESSTLSSEKRTVETESTSIQLKTESTIQSQSTSSSSLMEDSTQNKLETSFFSTLSSEINTVETENTSVQNLFSTTVIENISNFSNNFSTETSSISFVSSTQRENMPSTLNSIFDETSTLSTTKFELTNPDVTSDNTPIENLSTITDNSSEPTTSQQNFVSNFSAFSLQQDTDFSTTSFTQIDSMISTSSSSTLEENSTFKSAESTILFETSTLISTVSRTDFDFSSSTFTESQTSSNADATLTNLNTLISEETSIDSVFSSQASVESTIPFEELSISTTVSLSTSISNEILTSTNSQTTLIDIERSTNQIESTSITTKFLYDLVTAQTNDTNMVSSFSTAVDGFETTSDNFVQDNSTFLLLTSISSDDEIGKVTKNDLNEINFNSTTSSPNDFSSIRSSLELFSFTTLTLKDDKNNVETTAQFSEIQTTRNDIDIPSTQFQQEEITLTSTNLPITSSSSESFFTRNDLFYFNVSLKLDQTFREEYRNRSSPEFIILHQDLSNYVRKSLEDNGLNGLQYILINQVNPGSILVSFDLIYKQLNNENVDEETLLKALTSRNNLGDNLNVVYSNTQVSKINDNNNYNTNQPTFETTTTSFTTTTTISTSQTSIVEITNAITEKQTSENFVNTRETTSSQLFDTFQSTVNNSDILTTQSESQSTSKDIESTISTFPQEITSLANLLSNQTDILSTTQLESESTTIIQSQSTSPSSMEISSQSTIDDSTQSTVETGFFSTPKIENISVSSLVISSTIYSDTTSVFLTQQETNPFDFSTILSSTSFDTTSQTNSTILNTLQPEFSALINTIVISTTPEIISETSHANTFSSLITVEENYSFSSTSISTIDSSISTPSPTLTSFISTLEESTSFLNTLQTESTTLSTLSLSSQISDTTESTSTNNNILTTSFEKTTKQELNLEENTISNIQTEVVTSTIFLDLITDIKTISTEMTTSLPPNFNYSYFALGLKVKQNYTNQLKDQSSEEYLSFQASLGNFIQKALIKDNIKGKTNLIIVDVLPGSIQVVFILVYQLSSSNMNEETVIDSARILNALKTYSSLSDQLFQVEKESIHIISINSLLSRNEQLQQRITTNFPLPSEMSTEYSDQILSTSTIIDLSYSTNMNASNNNSVDFPIPTNVNNTNEPLSLTAVSENNSSSGGIYSNSIVIIIASIFATLTLILIVLSTLVTYHYIKNKRLRSHSDGPVTISNFIYRI